MQPRLRRRPSEPRLGLPHLCQDHLLVRRSPLSPYLTIAAENEAEAGVDGNDAENEDDDDIEGRVRAPIRAEGAAEDSEMEED